MKSIAAELGVSVGLVSKVLSGKMGTTGASPRMQKRILNKARDLGYVPNRSAVALFTGKKGTIGLFINPWGGPGSDLPYSLMQGVTHGLSASTYHMWFNIFQEDSQFHRLMNLQDVRHRIDGLVVGGVPHPKLLAPLRMIEKAGIPVITFFNGATETETKTVNYSVDIQQQCRLPTDHLILGCGCKRIVHLNTIPERLRGYTDALRAAGIPVRENYIFRCSGFGYEEGRAVVRKLLRMKLPFDGIVAQSDQQALGAVQELLAHGIDVPGRVKITGVDDSPLCLMSPVSLTSVTSECYQIGQLIIENIVRKIKGEQIASALLDPRLVLRDSTR